ncbi:hypothetical protein DB30_04951 [Enhygromyxa salina]|uniref:Uncharacterized protein n=1 Tax=Enhygromyxa salina TaxID=215803 RepID=A0A0C1ZEH8_9BACT|nr:hypothetical protein DB30_04951 [Enhygromyxa salina]
MGPAGELLSHGFTDHPHAREPGGRFVGCSFAATLANPATASGSPRAPNEQPGKGKGDARRRQL